MSRHPVNTVPTARGPSARRAQRILRQVQRRPLTTAEIEKTLQPDRLLDQDPAAHGLRVRATINRLAREGCLVLTPAGWRPATAA